MSDQFPENLEPTYIPPVVPEPVAPPPPPTYVTPPPPPAEKKSKTWLIVLIVALVLLCCCCTVGAGVALWQNGDEWFDLSFKMMMLLA